MELLNGWTTKLDSLKAGSLDYEIGMMGKLLRSSFSEPEAWLVASIVGIISYRLFAVMFFKRRPYRKAAARVRTKLVQDAAAIEAEEDAAARYRFTASRLAKAQASLGADAEWDVILIGSGPGGLSCAAALAQIGKRCLVLEQGEQLGGGSHVFSEAGYEFETGVHYLGEDPQTGLEASLSELRPLLGSDLKVLHLAGNGGVVGSLEVLSPCVNLTACRLGFTNVRGDLSVFSTHMPQLASLMLGGCPSIGGDLGGLESLRQLEELSLWRTGTTGNVACFAKLKELRECYLGGCIGIKGDAAAAFGALALLRVLDVAGTQCSGAISTRGGELKVWAADAPSVVVGS